MSRNYRVACHHHWVRDDATTKQCVHCGTYAPIKDGDFE